MKNSEFLLFFFIIFNILSNLFWIYIWSNTKDISDKKSEYIDELIFELAKMRRK